MDDSTTLDSQEPPSGAGDSTPPDTDQASWPPAGLQGGWSTLDTPVTPMVVQDWMPEPPGMGSPSPVPLPYDQVQSIPAPPAFPGTPAGASYAPPPLNPSQPLYAAPPVNPSQPLYAPPPPAYGAYPPPPVVPMVMTGRPEHPSRTAAIIVEVILDLFGIYGVGWLIAGETTVGILLLVGSFIWWPVALFLTFVTVGIGLICFFPLYIAFLVLSVVMLSQRTAARAY